MLKNLQFAFAIKVLFVAVTFLPCFCNSAFAQRPDTIRAMTTKDNQVVNFNVLISQKVDTSLNRTLNAADSPEPYSPPDNGGPKRSQGSGTRNN